MALSKERVAQVSAELINAEKSRVPIQALTERFPDVSYEDAYAIQLKTFDSYVKSGAVIVGKKIGLTSKAMQDQFGIREPDYGMITDRMVAREGAPLPMNSLILPRIEPEIAFLLKEDLKGPGINVANVIEATEGVMPAFEVIDSRYKDWKITVKDSISDNASAGVMILGGKLTPIKDLDLRYVGMVLEKNGLLVSTGAGAAVLGNPAQSVAWLANKLTEYGITLKKGEFVMSGSLVQAVTVEAGSCLRASFDRLGSVSVSFE
ncbi:MAG: 2-keto-4-pentenoate hydratase [Dehalococcoidia bacterium]|nr:2-keto-4-pentenoate hydratase [Dehalococcoidia bacterium]